MMRIAAMVSRSQSPRGLKRSPISGRTAYQGFVSLVDQGVASATNFLTTVIIGKFAGINELGIYALAFTLMVMLSGVQDSLVGQPYIVFANRRRGHGARFTGGNALIHTLALGLVATVVLAIAAGVTMFYSQTTALARVLLVLAGVAPCLLVRDLARRMAFAHLRVEVALAVDVSICTLQLGTLCLLAWTGTLSAMWAQLTVGVSCAGTCLVWFLLHRRRFVVRTAQVKHAALRSWKFGRWLLAASLTYILNAYFVHWLLMFVMDSAATGAYAACMTIMMLSNPVIIGIGNLLGPRAAREFAAAGAPALRRITWLATLLLVGLLGLFAVVLWWWGGWLLEVLYGSEFAEYAYLIRILAGMMLFNAAAVPSACALLAMRRTDLSFRVSFVGGITTILASILLIGPFGMLGAAWGSFAGTVAGSLVGIGSVYWLTAASAAKRPAAATLDTKATTTSQVVASSATVEVSSL